LTRDVRVDFGPYTFDSARCLLTRNGEPVHLSRKAFALLELLLGSRPAVVTKSQILDQLWPDCHVTEGSVASLVSEIRAALDGDWTTLRTVHGVGYAFALEATPAAGAACPAATAHCKLIEKGPPARELSLPAGATLVGRSLECAVRVPSSTVSRVHACIDVGPGGALIEDLGSRNGTFVRGVRITRPVQLTDSDTIRIGPAEFIFRIEAPPESETESVV
jgi:DNA-binding winged helix-turn-helix (wHTH) protein